VIVPSGRRAAMGSGKLKKSVRAAIGSEWEAFAQAHPKLVAVIDESLVVDAAMESLSESVEYQETMADAMAMGTAAETMVEFVGKFVKRWLRQLV
jgi:hypothetical protein